MPMPPDPGTAPLRAGAVITACRIGPILGDTVLSLLNQVGCVADPVILVIDGCTHTQTTGAIMARFTRAFPRVHSVWLENGGVSRARNAGVKAALEMAPDLDAIFLLDGDDLIPPNALASSLEVLRAARTEAAETRPGWVYFDQTQFGANTAALRYPPAMSPPRWLGSNLSQPSCLYAAEMFRRGVFWDEGMRQGIEDWEFWYSAIAAGFHGVFNPDTSLRYRRLAGNRSSLNRSKDHLTKRYMRTKHKALLAPSRLLAWEARDQPRWAFHDAAADSWRLATDPEVTTGIATWDKAEAAFGQRAAQYNPRAVMLDAYFPDLAAILTPAADAALRRAGLLHATLCRAEVLLGEAPFAILREVTDADAVLDPHPGPLAAGDVTGVAGLFLSTTGLAAQMERRAMPDQGPSTDAPEAPAVNRGHLFRRLVGGLRRSSASPNSAPVATKPQAEPPLPLRIVARIEARMRAAKEALGPTAFLREENKYCGIDKAHHKPLMRELVGAWPLLPRLKADGLVDLALILPPDGLEDAEWFLASVLAPHLARCRLHLVAPGRTPAPPGRLGLPEETCRLTLDLDPAEPPHGLAYIDVPLFEKLDADGQAQAVGRLAVMDRVVNFCGPVLAGPLMALRKLGIDTALCAPGRFDPTPALDRRPQADMAAGNLLGIHSHGAAYGRVICRSAAQARLLAATGVAEARLDIGGRGWAAAFAEDDVVRNDALQHSA